MNTNVQPQQTIILLYVTNRLNLAQVADIKECLYPWITQPDVHIILDLRHVHFMDCCAVSCIISMNRIAHSNHTVLTLCNLMENVKLLADALNLYNIIDIDNKQKHNTSKNISNTIKNIVRDIKCIHLF